MILDTIEHPIFMIGMGRSGTTVISEAISLHPRLGWFSNYLNRVPSMPCVAILDRVAAHPAWGWRLRGKKHQGNGLLSSIRRLLPHTDEAYRIWRQWGGEKFLRDYLIQQTASPEEAAHAHHYIKKVLRYQGKERFFTKLTGPPRIHYLRSIFPDAAFVHVVRDPRAVISSLLQVSFWREGQGTKQPWWENGLPEKYIEEWESHGRSPVALAAVQWKRVVELTWEEKEALPPGRFIELRYEDFIKSPHQSISDLFRFLHLDDASAAHHYLSTFGNIRNMNYKFREQLPAGEIKIIEQLTWQAAKIAGYDFENTLGE